MARLYSVVLASLLAAGCQNQSNTLSNPFLAADRVPPPSTRAAGPGTAQPYYPNPGVAAPTAPPGGVYSQAPAGAFPTGPTTPQPTLPATPTAAPGGTPYQYNTPYRGAARPDSSFGGQFAHVSVEEPAANNLAQAAGDQVRIPSDQGALRFDLPAAPLPPSMAQAASGAPGQNIQTSGAAARTAELASMRMPIQTLISGSGGTQQATPAASPWPVQQAGYAAESAGGGWQNPTATVRPASAGGQSRPGARQSQFRGPVVAPLQGEARDSRFGYATDRSWLRGQLLRTTSDNRWLIQFAEPGVADGAIVIDNPQVLGTLSHGDYVVLQGRWQQPGLSAASVGPTYRVAVVRRQQP